MLNSRQNFRLFLLVGFIATCVLGGVSTWVATGGVLTSLQEDTLASRDQKIADAIDSRVGDQVNGLQYLARRARIVSVVMGNETEIENVRDIVRTFDLHDELMSVRVVDVLGETLLAEQTRGGVPANLRDEVAAERSRLQRWRADVTELYPRVVAATEEGR